MQLGAVEAFKELSAFILCPFDELAESAPLSVKERLASKPEIAERLIPGFPVACRRFVLLLLSETCPH